MHTTLATTAYVAYLAASVAIALSEQIRDDIAACCPPADPVQSARDKQL